MGRNYAGPRILCQYNHRSPTPGGRSKDSLLIIISLDTRQSLATLTGGGGIKTLRKSHHQVQEHRIFLRLRLVKAPQSTACPTSVGSAEEQAA